MGLRSESDRRDIASERERFHRECMTPKDDWGNDFDGYINNLLNLPSYEWVTDQNGNRELKTLRGIESIEKHFHDHIDDPENYCYGHAKGRGYFDWMVAVRDRYLELKKAGKIKDIDKAKAERKELEYWKNYYDTHPQFRRPEGI